jgi:hypothetical protein
MIPNSVANSKEKQLRAAHNKFELAGLPNSPQKLFQLFIYQSIRLVELKSTVNELFSGNVPIKSYGINFIPSQHRVMLEKLGFCRVGREKE